MSNNFFDFERMLQIKDRNGERPELFIVTSRQRSVGKTYSVGKTFIKRFLETGDKFIILTRYGASLGSLAAGQYKAVLDQEYDGKIELYEKVPVSRDFSYIRMKVIGDDGEVHEYDCGYCIPLNAFEDIKRISSLFVDAVWAHFDEFMPEKGDYIKDEIAAFLSIHGSLARGGGESRRYFPVIMTGNDVDITNPYFVGLGLTNKIQENTKLYRGNGFVYRRFFEQGFIAAHEQGGMNRAFSGQKEIAYKDNTWLNSTSALIEKPKGWGLGTYYFTLLYEDKEYAVRYYYDAGLWYIGGEVDKDFPVKVNGTLTRASAYPYVKDTPAYNSIKKAIRNAKVRFQNPVCKNVAFECLL